MSHPRFTAKGTQGRLTPAKEHQETDPPALSAWFHDAPEEDSIRISCSKGKDTLPTLQEGRPLEERLHRREYIPQ